MKQLIKIYKRLIIMNFAVLTSHRAAFINHLVGGTVWGIFSLAVMLLLTSKVTSIYTWSKEEMLLLSGVLAVLLGVFNTLFQGNFDNFPQLVNKGKLDTFLLKPLDAQLSLSLWNIKIMSLSRVMVGIIFMVYVISVYQLSVNFAGIFISIPLFVFGIGLYYSIWSIVTTLTIWFDRATNIVEILHSIQGVMRLPPVVFQELSITLFMIVFPLAVIASTPVGLFLGSPSITDVLLLIFLSFLFLLISRKFWIFALRSYTSASS